ncbi:hypothetical protein BJI67_05600 [Acidihalobacter aeolianus]|uniref:Methyltransferase type 11 domain-containing protein n=1 Tax=Acidihalobacter aeolianus TaxID=2792603 RepID=A0A1D8K6M8_9GAMM|nr:methyltransferase domain-containing protein [Acidihalobacter aeolianus]AOV16611.1 hypothetical protein BJI67_05600 [Acidihalobacter aeolianus]
MPLEAADQWIQRVADATLPRVTQSGPHAWLLRQSLYTHFQRLVALSSLGEMGGDILDVGAGTGALTLDLAWHAQPGSRITAVDNDAVALALLADIARDLNIAVTCLEGEADKLPLPDASQSMTVARYVFQHLPQPSLALHEMRRVTQPGGRILIVDVDDGIALGEPPESSALAGLREAIRNQQARAGGNRFIGRHLYRMMRDAGLESIQVIIMPRVRLGLQHGRNGQMEEHQTARMLSERDALIEAGLITAEAFDAGIEALRHDFAEDRFELDADFIAVGRVPAGK